MHVGIDVGILLLASLLLDKLVAAMKMHGIRSAQSVFLFFIEPIENGSNQWIVGVPNTSLCPSTSMTIINTELGSINYAQNFQRLS